MKANAKSFMGGIAGGLLVLLVAFFLTNDNTRSQTTELGQPNQTPVEQAAYLPPQNIDFTEAAKKSVDAVVHIKTVVGIKPRSYDDFFGSLRDYLHGYPQQRNALIAFGSGVILSPNGYIVTNNHVVNGADKITVTFNDKREMEAKIIGTSPSTDLALIKVDAKDLPFLTYGNSDQVEVGQWVLAVGNPFNLTSTVTAGIISAKARNIHILGKASSIESFIQTDAAVNPGNSGGALVNTKGQLIGINAAIASQTGAYEGYSFAIPVNLVRKVVDDLMKYGEIQRAYLGVQIRDINADFAKKMGIHDLQGVYVAGLTDQGGAQDAGIRTGDIITAINSKPIRSLSELMETIGQYNPGNEVKVHVLRDDKEKVFRVTLKNKNGTVGLVKSAEMFFNNQLGANLKPLSDDDLSELGLDHGVQVVQVRKGLLASGGVSQGFIITEINHQAVNSEKDIQQAMKHSDTNVVSISGMYRNGMRISFEFMR
jgi:serine protease Do